METKTCFKYPEREYLRVSNAKVQQWRGEVGNNEKWRGRGCVFLVAKNMVRGSVVAVCFVVTKWIMIGIIYFHNPVYLGGKYIFIIYNKAIYT